MINSDAEPVPFSTDSLEVYLRRRGGGGGGVYLALLLMLGAVVVALPLVSVPVSVRAQGFLRTAEDTHLIAAPASAVVVRVRAREARKVRAGDTLVLLARPVLDARNGALQARQAVLADERGDLERLLAWTDGGPSVEPSSLRYGNEWRGLMAEVAALKDQEGVALRELQRASALLERGLIASAEVATLQDRVGRLQSDAVLLRLRASTRWRGDLAGVKEAQHSLLPEIALLTTEVEQLAVISPVTGTIDQMSALSPGSYVIVGQELAMIAPESDVIAEVYVAPKDLGSLSRDGTVRLQLDAFRFSEWGAVTGTIIEVSEELQRIDGKAVGRVRVRPTVGTAPGPLGETELRRGSSVSARFPVARRSVWSLLRQRREDRNRADAARPSGSAPGPG